VLASLAVTAAFAAAGCGSGASKPILTGSGGAGAGQLEGLASRCNEPESRIAAQLVAALKNLRRHGLRGSPQELSQALDTLSAYAADREPTVHCTALLHALVETFEQHHKRRGKRTSHAPARAPGTSVPSAP